MTANLDGQLAPVEHINDRFKSVTSYIDFRPTFRLRDAMALSYDGKSLAYADDAAGQFDLVVKEVDGGKSRRLTHLSNGSVRSVGWHPGGASLVYFADTGGDEHAQVYLCDADGTSTREVTANPGAHYRPAGGRPFSPDGHLLAYSGNDRDPSADDILISDLDTDEVRRVPVGSGFVYAGHWSPDGQRLTVTNWRRGMEDHAVFVLSVADGVLTQLTSDDLITTYTLGPWLADGSGFLVLSHGTRDYTGLAVMNPDNGDMTWLDTPESDVEALALSDDGHILAWLVNIDGRSELRARDMHTGQPLDVPALPTGVVLDFLLSPDGRSVYLQLSTSVAPNNIVVMDLVTGDLRPVTAAVPTNADPSTFVEPELVRYPGRAGHQIPAYLFRPTASSEPVAVVISVHGGPTFQERPRYNYDGFYQFLLSQGVAILAPNIRGSDGYGHRAAQEIYRRWGTIDLDDIADAVAYLRAQPWVDPDRIGIWGASYGGFVALSAVSRQPELNWAAAVSLYGISNLVTVAKAAPPTWRSWIVTAIGDYEADADSLLERSPITYADNIRAPLLIIQGANDIRVPQAESDQIVAAMQQHCIPVRYDVYPDEGHGFTGRDNQIKSMSDAAEFLITHLEPTRKTSRPEQ